MTNLTEALSEHHYPLEISNSLLTGRGADFLRTEAQRARFMLIAEEHGVGSNLDFSAALFDLIHPLGYGHYVTEVGPISAGHLNRLAREADVFSAFAAFYKKYPFSIPFAWLQEEIKIQLAVCAASPEDKDAVIGIDQEFVFSPQLHLETLLNFCADPAFKEKLESWLEVEQQVNRDMVAGITPDKLFGFMNQALPEEWDALYKWFETNQSREALFIMDALNISHQIYMYYKNGEYYNNNNVRGHLMRKYFLDAYRRITAEKPDARFLTKLGANHISRGHGSMGIQDIGNFISELALMENTESFHLFVVPTSGALNAWLPFLPDSFKIHPISVEDYGSAIKRLLDAAPVKTGWNLYDLRPLRQRQMHWSKDDPDFRDLFLRYDAVLFMDDTRAARLIIE